LARKLLTIGVPIYKRYDFLSNLLAQIDKQVTDRIIDDFEVVICDNTGASKEGFEQIERFLRKKYIRYIDNGENIGIINNMCKVIENSLGKYCFLAGDDEELLEGKLEKCINFVKTVPSDIIGVIFDETAIMTDNKIINYFEAAEKYFWYIGNLGCTIYDTDMIKNYIPHFYGKDTIWPETELVFSAAVDGNYSFFICKDRIMHSPNHRNNTRYNSYYLFEAGYFSLLRTVFNVDDQEFRKFAIINVNSRYNKDFLLSLLLLYIYNDTTDDTKKTRMAIEESKNKYYSYISDKRIFCFNILSYIPKWIYRMVLKMLNKDKKLKNTFKNKNPEKPKISDDYT
jgi:hypothetical protein